MYCVGICNSSPDQVLGFLKKRGYGRQDVIVCGLGKKFTAKPKKKVMMFLRADDVYNNLQYLNKVCGPTDILIVVLGSAVSLNEISGLTPLDFSYSPESQAAFRFSPISAQKFTKALAKETILKRKSGEYLTTLVMNVKQGSLLTPLMTFIYTLSGSAQQNPVREALVEYFCDCKNDEWVEKRVSPIISPNKLERLRSILASDVAKAVRKVFSELKKHKELIPTTVCKKYGVQPYEVTYLRASFRKNVQKKAA